MSEFYIPKLDILEPFFGVDSRIDSKAKAFAFLLGLLYGKHQEDQWQGERESYSPVFHSSKLLSLTGKDLPSLCSRLQHDLPTHCGEHQELVNAILEEVRHLQISLGNVIGLDHEETTYFLLLGFSQSRKTFSEKKPSDHGP